MGQPVKAADYLASPEKFPAQAVCVAFGDEAFLKRQALARLRQSVLGSGEGDFSMAAFDGSDAQWCDVLEELSTVAMFGGNRLVAVEEGDDFVTRYRAELEDYVARPRRTGILVLDVKGWPATTRLYKAVAAAGLAIDCRPLEADCRREEDKDRIVAAWVTAWAKTSYHLLLSGPTAEELVDLAGRELGLLDQELAKLALVASPGGKVTPDQVRQVAGSWRSRTVWEMLDALLDGNVREALVQLDRLMLAGETPVGILAQVASNLRRFAAATRIIRDSEAAGRRVSLREALTQAGVKWRVEDAERRLKRLGRERGAKIYDWLLQADLDLKGDSPLPPRLVLEQLFVRLGAATQGPAAEGRGRLASR